MNNLSRIVVCLLLILTASCSYYSHYVENEQKYKACHLDCLAKKDHCNAICRNNCKECTGLADLQAAKRFKDYKHRRTVQKKLVDLELQSFKDPLQCRKVTCSCQDDFRVCAQACKGKIKKNLKAKAVCQEKLNGT